MVKSILTLAILEQGGHSTQQRFMWESSASKSNLLLLYVYPPAYTFSEEWYPFHIPTTASLHVT